MSFAGTDFTFKGEIKMNIIKKITVAFFVAAILLTFSACGKNIPASFIADKEKGAINVSADTEKKDLYISRKKSKMKRIAKSDMIELYFDKNNCTVSVYDTASGKLWSSLPEKEADEKTSAVAVSVFVKGNLYTLSSQSDSVGFSSALYEVKKNGVTVNYRFKRTLEDGMKINLYVPVSYTLIDGALTVEADCSNIMGENHDDGIIVAGIDILPFFGSDAKGKDGDYILLPDGCGATVDLSENPKKFKGISLPVYKENNVLGAFGMKKGDSAFVAFIDEGEEIAEIKAQKALAGGGLNKVYSSFEITPVKDTEDKVYICNESYKGKIRLIYRFLSYDNANYVGMAGAVRELLIRNGHLLSELSEDKTFYPFNLSVIFQNFVTDAKGRIRTQTLTTYRQAQEMLDSLKAKGIENINLRLKGVLTDDDITKAEYSKVPGSMKDFEDLLSYAATGGVSFFTDSPLVTASDKGNYSAVNLDGEYITAENKFFIKGERIGDSTNALLSLMRKTGGQGVCINDAGKELYGDFSADGLTLKSQMADMISKQTGAVSASGKLMIDTGNIYASKYADVLVNVPSSAEIQNRDLCAGVPFIQSVLHGIVDYSCEPVNSFKNSEKAFLKNIEYGAVPYYEWYASDLSAEGKTDKSSYINYITEAQLQHERAKAAFKDLRDARITDHYEVRDNVYYTCYDNRTGIYVNYNSKPVTVSGVTVEGKSFLRVN